MHKTCTLKVKDGGYIKGHRANFFYKKKDLKKTHDFLCYLVH